MYYDYTFVNVVMQLVCSLMLGIILISLLISENKRDPLNRIFALVTVLILTALIGDIFAWAFDLRQGGIYRALTVVGNFLVYSCGITGNAVLVLYIAKSIPLKKQAERAVMGATWFIAAVFNALLIASQFTGWIYYVDSDNMYHLGPLGWAALAACGLIYAIVIVVVLRHKKQLGLRHMLSYISYIALPVIAIVVNYFYIDLMTVHASWALALLVIYVNIQVQQEKQLKDKELELQSQQISIMLGQIQPHFLYNSLTAINALSAGNTKVQKALSTFSQYLRVNMDSLNQKMPVPFETELKHIKHYLWLEELRFDEKLRVVYDIRTTDFMIPVLTVQPIVENAVFHGLLKKPGGGTLTIRTEETKNEYIITVADDGAGFDTSEKPKNEHHEYQEYKVDEKSHIGIENVRSRLDSMCGGSLTIYSRIGEGTRVSIKIPKNAEDRSAL